MVWRRLAATLVVSIVLLSACVAGSPETPRPPPSERDPSLALRSSVQITLVAARTNALGQPDITVTDGRPAFRLVHNEGLGTAVRAGERALIITHAHWCQLNKRLLYVEIRDYQGQTLAYLEPQVFRRSIIYLDSGTLVFLAPETVPTFVRMGDLPTLEGGETVHVVSRPDGGEQLQIVRATITAVHARARPATFRFRRTDGRPLAAGDSGAGVWLGNELQGTVWSVLDEQSPGAAPCTPQATAVSIAARLPRLDALR